MRVQGLRFFVCFGSDISIIEVRDLYICILAKRREQQYFPIFRDALSTNVPDVNEVSIRREQQIRIITSETE